MKQIFLLELKKLFCGLRAYFFIGFMILVSGLLISYLNLYNGYPNIEYTLELISLTLLVSIPFLCAEAFSSDTSSGFDTMLHALGLKSIAVILGKFFSYCIVFLISFVFIFIMPFIFMIFTKINIAGAISGMTGYLLIGLALISISLFISSVVKKRLFAYLSCYGVMVFIYLCGLLAGIIPVYTSISFFTLSLFAIALAIIIYFITKSESVCITFAVIFEATLISFWFAFPSLITKICLEVLKVISISSALGGFNYGLFNVKSLLYLLSVTFVFLCFTTLRFEKRKYD